MESLQYQRTVLAGQEGQRKEALRAAETLAAEREKALRIFIAENETKRADAARQVDELTPRLAKALVRIERLTLRSPATGVVQASTVTTRGQVLGAGQEAMRIVPRDEGLEIEVYLANKDVGFVREGQTATLKLEAFPFTRHGTLPATVVRVASDAIPEPDARQAEADPTRGARKSVRRGRPARAQPGVPRGAAHACHDHRRGRPERAPLAGMAVTAEIKTGTRRIIDYVLGPLVETTSTAGRER